MDSKWKSISYSYSLESENILRGKVFLFSQKKNTEKGMRDNTKLSIIVRLVSFYHEKAFFSFLSFSNFLSLVLTFVLFCFILFSNEFSVNENYFLSSSSSSSSWVANRIVAWLSIMEWIQVKAREWEKERRDKWIIEIKQLHLSETRLKC